MIDFTKIGQATLIARGKYSTVRSEHEDAKKELSRLCGLFMANLARFQNQMQEDGFTVRQSLIASLWDGLTDLQAAANTVESLAAQRAALKQEAWK